MSLKLLLQPVDVQALHIDLKADSLYHSLYVFEEQLPRWKTMNIAIIGVNEYRGQDMEMMTSAATKVRKKLYQLKQQKHSLKVADLGDIINGETYQDTIDRLTEVCKLLLEEKVIPLIIGGSHDLDVAQYKAFEHLEKDLKITTIDASLDLSEEGKPYEKHLRDILLHEPNFLFNFSHLGHQTYLHHPHAVDLLEKMNCDHLRLGVINSDIQKAEPYIRFADMISFDLAAIRQSDFNAGFDPQPFGLSSEYACQIAWYAGISNNCRSFGIYGYYPEMDGRLQGASVIAVMLWYFIDGFYHRQQEQFSSDDYRKFNVDIDGEHLIFLKDIRSDKWWVQIEGANGKIYTVPCAHLHYEEATKGEIPQHVFDMQLKYK